MMSKVGKYAYNHKGSWGNFGIVLLVYSKSCMSFIIYLIHVRPERVKHTPTRLASPTCV